MAMIFHHGTTRGLGMPVVDVVPLLNEPPHSEIDAATKMATNAAQGRFRYLFPDIDGLSANAEILHHLGDAMAAPREAVQTPESELDAEENPAINAGYTYLGQFVDHDLTFDPISILDGRNDPRALRDFRTPRFDLDSLYGGGPADQPYLYETDGMHLLLGAPLTGSADPGARDLIRDTRGRALIGDPRNDENRIVAQLHSLFIRFHNLVVDQILQTDVIATSPPPTILAIAQRRVRLLYQSILLSDFLPTVVNPKIVSDVLGANPKQPNLLLYPKPMRPPSPTSPMDPVDRPFMPFEFSVAAYRFGHSMVRPIYRLNDIINRIPIFDGDNPDPTADLTGFRPLPSGWAIDWKFFFDTDPSIDPFSVDPNTHQFKVKIPRPRRPLQKAYKIDTSLVAPLTNLPSSIVGQMRPRSLAERNLLRGWRLGVPDAEGVISQMKAKGLNFVVLSPAQRLVGKATDDPADPQTAIGDVDPFFTGGNTPLWYYLLREAQELTEGGKPQHHPTRLGPVGGRIVVETFVGIMLRDGESLLNADDADIRDALGAFSDITGPLTSFSMTQLIKVVAGAR